MPEDDNTETVMNRTSLTGLHPGSVLESNRLLRQVTKRNLTLWWQMMGVPQPMAETYARMATLTS